MTIPFSLRNKTVWIAGHRGLAGSAAARALAGKGCRVLTADRAALDLRRQAQTEDWLAGHRPDAVVLAAATVGGIAANEARPADFIHDNIAIASNVVHGAFRTGVAKLLFLGSSCIYPRDAAQPVAEDALLSGPLEPTNEWYAVAKIAGVKLCQAYRRQHGCDFISVMPCNLYGPGDTYDAQDSHVIPALMMKMDEAVRAGRDKVTLWGTGRALREFLYVDDLAEALVLLLERYSGEAPVNAGGGREITVADLAAEIAAVTGFRGEIAFDRERPDGAPRKIVDSRRLAALGWAPRTVLRDGLEKTWRDYKERYGHGSEHAA